MSRIGSNDIAKARAFYDPLMWLIGFRVLKASTTAAHYGTSDIVFSLKTPVGGSSACPVTGVHIAFQAPDQKRYGAFCYALEQGGQDEGRRIPVDLQCQYYAAFVRDPDGNKIEVTYTVKASARYRKPSGFPKTSKRQEVVIAGFTAPRRTRPFFGALALAVREKDIGGISAMGNRHRLQP